MIMMANFERNKTIRTKNLNKDPENNEIMLRQKQAKEPETENKTQLRNSSYNRLLTHTGIKSFQPQQGRCEVSVSHCPLRRLNKWLIASKISCFHLAPLPQLRHCAHLSPLSVFHLIRDHLNAAALFFLLGKMSDTIIPQSLCVPDYIKASVRSKTLNVRLYCCACLHIQICSDLHERQKLFQKLGVTWNF